MVGTPMPDVIEQLHQDHLNVDRLLDLLQSEILAIHVGKTPDYVMMRDIMRYMTHYPDHFHHPKEDLIFIRLLKRAPGAHRHIHDLLEEHKSIADAGQRFLESLQSTLEDSVALREQTEALSLSYIASLRSHMLKEEEKIFPLARVLLTRSDWAAINEETEIMRDPIFGSLLGEEYRRLFHRITGNGAAAFASASDVKSTE